MKLVEVGKWQPDLGTRRSSVYDVSNMVWVDGRYKPFRAIAPTGALLSGTPMSMAAYLNLTELAYFIFTTTKIYREVGGVRLDVSKSGGYTGTVINPWVSSVYGTTFVATNGVDPIQVLPNMTTQTPCADLSGSPPKAKTLAVYNDHLFLGSVTEGGTAYPRRVWRSKKGDIGTWVPDSNTGCGFRDLPEWGDEIVALKPIGDNLAVYCTNAIWFLYAVGAPYWFSYNRVYRGRGPIAHNAIAEVDKNTHVFLSAGDIHTLNSAGQVTSVGAGLNERVFSTLSGGLRPRITNAVDPVNMIVYWAFPTNMATNNRPDKVLIYNIAEQAMTMADYEINCLGQYVSGGVTIDSLDSYGTISALPSYPVDSEFWTGGRIVVGGINAGGYVGSLSGAALDGKIVSPEILAGNDKMLHLHFVRPLIEFEGIGSYPTVQLVVHTTDAQNVHHAVKATEPMRSDGLIELRTSGRSMQFEFQISGNHTGMTGFMVELTEDGAR